MHCHCGTLYRQVCAIPNQLCAFLIKLISTGGPQSSCRKISRMINGNRIHLSSISSLIGSEYLCK
jgi:hypothetical protein